MVLSAPFRMQADLMSWTLRLRHWHAYIGLFIAPSVLFFALTGALQIFNLHEAHDSYTPPPLIQKLSAVHQDQVFEASDAHHHAPGDDDKVTGATLALKWYFCAVAVGLAVSTLIGIWMGLTQIRRKGLAWILLIAGTLLPLSTFLL
jgi:hypothetical protein